LEGLTVRRSRQAVRALAELQPQTARVLRYREEATVPVEQVGPGEVVVVRPGERLPVDGCVVEGHAPVDEAPITGVSVPVEKGPGDLVYAATIVQAGCL